MGEISNSSHFINLTKNISDKIEKVPFFLFLEAITRHCSPVDINAGCLFDYYATPIIKS